MIIFLVIFTWLFFGGLTYRFIQIKTKDRYTRKANRDFAFIIVLFWPLPLFGFFFYRFVDRYLEP